LRTFRDIKRTLCVFLEGINSTRILKATPPLLSQSIYLPSHIHRLSIHLIMHLPQLRSMVAAPVIAAVLLSSSGTQAIPTSVSAVISRAIAPLQPRAKTGINGMGIPSLIAAVREYLKEEDAYVCACI
jgi:hypothetical protein